MSSWLRGGFGIVSGRGVKGGSFSSKLVEGLLTSAVN